ncbi:hypothetical protein BKA81DRAFT_65355 [Phyllosticta paracitricarpa]|uniref:Uncharacterized protein n=1 Tax=Phyllosticta paracitricarpa TaxID=2016321 RepID=A0ABR1NEN1_9PEZI
MLPRRPLPTHWINQSARVPQLAMNLPVGCFEYSITRALSTRESELLCHHPQQQQIVQLALLRFGAVSTAYEGGLPAGRVRRAVATSGVDQSSRRMRSIRYAGIKQFWSCTGPGFGQRSRGPSGHDCDHDWAERMAATRSAGRGRAAAAAAERTGCLVRPGRYTQERGLAGRLWGFGNGRCRQRCRGTRETLFTRGRVCSRRSSCEVRGVRCESKSASPVPQLRSAVKLDRGEGEEAM